MQRGREVEGSAGRILDGPMFYYLLDHEVRRARRYQNFICVLHFQIRRISEGEGQDQQQACHETLGDFLSLEIRDSDIIAPFGDKGWLVLLPYADLLTGLKAKTRLEAILKYFDFKKRGWDVVIDPWVFPVHWTDSEDLLYHLRSHEGEKGELG